MMSNLTCLRSELPTDALNVAESVRNHGQELVLLVEAHFAKARAKCLVPPAEAKAPKHPVPSPSSVRQQC